MCHVIQLPLYVPGPVPPRWPASRRPTVPARAGCPWWPRPAAAAAGTAGRAPTGSAPRSSRPVSEINAVNIEC